MVTKYQPAKLDLSIFVFLFLRSLRSLWLILFLLFAFFAVNSYESHSSSPPQLSLF